MREPLPSSEPKETKEKEVPTVTIGLTIPTETIERLKSSLPDLDHKKSATGAIFMAIERTIAEHGAVTLRQADLREIAQRASSPPLRSSQDVLAAFEAATQIGPYTLKIDIDPGVCEQINEFRLGTGMSFGEQCREIIHESAVDKYMYSCSDRTLRFADSLWRRLLRALGVDRIGNGAQLVDSVEAVKANGAVSQVVFAGPEKK